MVKLQCLKSREVPKRSSRRHRSFVVERVTGNVIYTCWDKEEALQLASRLIISGRETSNNIAVREIPYSLLPPPITEIGVLAAENHSNKRAVRNILSKCSNNSFSALGYCVEKLPVPNETDVSSVTRRRCGNHLIVRIARRGTWNPIHQRYLEKPIVLEIWHPESETRCACTSAY